MKFKASATQIAGQEARDIARRYNKRAGSGSSWKPPSPNTCKSYGCENDQTHDLVFRGYYRNGEDFKIGYCVEHVWSVFKIFHLYKGGCHVNRRQDANIGR